MQHESGQGITRRDFLKGLGALVLTALPACRRAQQFATVPEGCPEWQLPGEATAFATAMPWAGGAIPMLAVCHGGLPTMLQPNPHYEQVRRGLPAFAQATLTDLYSAGRPAGATFNGAPYPEQALQGAWRAWCTALRQGRRVACLFPGGYSPLRAAQTRELQKFAGISFYEYDPLAHSRVQTTAELDNLIDSTIGPAVKFNSGYGSLTELTAVLSEIELLLIFTPADPAGLCADFAAALQSTMAETVRFCPPGPTSYDRTAELCRYTVPLTHFLEEWGADADAHGNLCLRQPVCHPLRPAVSEVEALHALLHGQALPLSKRPDISPAREWLLQAVPQAEQILRRGVAMGVAPVPHPLPRHTVSEPAHYLHPFYIDGRYAHNPWLRETWFPLTGGVGAAEVLLPGDNRPCTAIVNKHELPACSLPGLAHPRLPLSPHTAGAVAVTPTANKNPLPHRSTRPLPPHSTGTPPPHSHDKLPQWALVINTALCDGCSACTLACRAENNIPTVGTADLSNHRDLQWLRINRFKGEDSHLLYQPLACRQCESAPCEAVCPVNATVHTDEGLNAMVYPRCWGTRYCAAACPYEARHFNFRNYSSAAQSTIGTPANPQVSLRPAGVMEKCTYCVQRINAARRNGSTPQTACQQACPRGAIRLVDLRSEAPVEVLTTFDSPATTPRTLYI